jgi:CelD/BcsL family acetyltransferase involved in cellulose biosynthesis
MARFELVTTVDRFIELEQAWRTLWQETGAMTFRSHPWLAAWVRHMDRRSYELKIGLVWQNDGRLIAVLPMAIRTFFGVRILEWAGQAVCDYCDGLGSAEGLQIAWKALLETRGIDIIRVKNIRPDAETTEIFTSDRLTPNDVCLKVVSSWVSGDAWFRTLNKKKRNNFSRGQRILEETGSTSMICHESVPDEALVRRLVGFKKTWLKATKRQSSCLFDDEHPDHLLNLMQALEQVGRLRVFVITCGDEIVSASINIAEGRSLGAFFSAYNSKFDRASPGIMLMTAYTRWAFDNGFTEVDYLQGDESYKFEFANARTTLFSFVAAVSLRGHAALMLHRGALQIAKFRENNKGHLQTGGAYLTKAGTARALTVAE